MRFILLLSATYFLVLSTYSQEIKGKVVSLAKGKPLEYVSIGVINEPIGTITNERGYFKLDTKGVSSNKTVRFSMIGYKSQSFTIDYLDDNNNLIRLDEEPIEIKEVTVTSKRGKTRKVGTSSLTRLGGVSGWGGSQFGAGHELGNKIDLGDNPVKIKSLHLRLYRQSFDSTFLRLHLRDIADNLPNKELLKENIILTVSKESGWVEIDLSSYDIILKGEVALTLEWINVYGENVNKLIRMNKAKEPTANVLFNVRKKKGLSLFLRRGSEAKWEV
jgi:hypothetical protein